MFKLTRVVGAAIAAVLFVGGAVQASALGAGFSGTVSPGCATPGQAITVTIPNLIAGAAVAVRLNYQDASGQRTQFASGFPNSQGTFTATLTLSNTAATGNAEIAIVVASTTPGIRDAEIGFSTVLIRASAGACPSPGLSTVEGSHFSVVENYRVKKTCASGVSGNAVFSVTVAVGEGGKFQFPALILHCNGDAGLLPALPIGTSTVVTLHETTAPANAVAAADVSFSLPPSSMPVVINNAKATAATTPAATPAVLPRTGGGPATPRGFPLWAPLLVLALLVAAGLTGNIQRRRR